MSRKRFIKIAMSQNCSKREAVFAANYVRDVYGSYAEGYRRFYGWIGGRFHPYVQ